VSIGLAARLRTMIRLKMSRTLIYRRFTIYRVLLKLKVLKPVSSSAAAAAAAEVADERVLTLVSM
jgi:hypothetical protein